MNIFDLFNFRDPSWMFMSGDGSGGDGGGDGGGNTGDGGGDGGGGSYDSGHYGGSYGSYGGNTYSGASGNYGGNYGQSYTSERDISAARDAAAANDPSGEFGGGVGPGAGQIGSTEGGNFPGADTGGAEQTAPSVQGFGGAFSSPDGATNLVGPEDFGDPTTPWPGPAQGQGPPTEAPLPARSPQQASQQGFDLGRLLGISPAAASEQIMPLGNPPQSNRVDETILSPWDPGALSIAPYPGMNNPFNSNPNQPGVQFAGNPLDNMLANAGLARVDPNAINPTPASTPIDTAINPVAPGKTDRLAADATPMDTLNQLLGPGEASVPTVTPGQFGFDPYAPQTQVADANVPLPTADPRTQVGDTTFDTAQWPAGPIGAPVQGQQGTQVASLNDPFRIGAAPAPLGPNDPLPGNVAPGNYGGSGLSDIATGGYAQNQGYQGSWISNLAQQAAMQPAPAAPAAPAPASSSPPPPAGDYGDGGYGPVVYPNTPPAPASGDTGDLYDLGTPEA
jgi:hypothetical protein